MILTFIGAINKGTPARVWWTDQSIPPGLGTLRIPHVTICVAPLQSVVRRIVALRGKNTAISPPVGGRTPTPQRFTSAEWRRVFAIAKLAAECGQFELSVRACDAAVPLIQRPFELIFLAAQAAIALRELGRIDDARRWVSAGLSVVRHAPEDCKSGIYNALGFIELEAPKPNVGGALRALRKAEKHQWRFIRATQKSHATNEPLVFLGRILNNIGWAYHVAGDWQEAVTAYQASIRFKRASGDVPGVAFTSANIARVLYEAGQLRQAGRWRRRAQVLCRDYMLVAQEASMLRDMAQVAIRFNRRKAAARLLADAYGLVKGTEYELIAKSIEQVRATLP